MPDHAPPFVPLDDLCRKVGLSPDQLRALPAPKGRALSPSQVASRLGVSRQTVTTLCRKGVLPAVQVGRTWRVDPDALDRYAKGETAPRVEAQALDVDDLAEAFAAALASEFAGMTLEVTIHARLVRSPGASAGIPTKLERRNR